MLKNVHKMIVRCVVCNKATGKENPYRLFILLPILEQPSMNISMYFVLGLHKTQHGKDSIMVVIYQFSKILNSIPYHKIGDVVNIIDLFFREVVHLHGVPKSIISNYDAKFLRHFWKILWKKLGTKLLFSTTCHPQIDEQTKVMNQTYFFIASCYK